MSEVALTLEVGLKVARALEAAGVPYVLAGAWRPRSRANRAPVYGDPG